MTFMVVLVTLLIERFFDWSHLRKWGWYGACEQMVVQKIPGASPYWVLAGSVIPLLIILGVMQYLFATFIYGFPWLGFQIAVILYCYGPHNLWADAFASINALTKEGKEAASAKIRAAFNVSEASNTQSLQTELLNQIFMASNRRVFAVVFWYAVLGLPGALFYRLINVSITAAAGSKMNTAARVIATVLDWVPVRVLTAIYALAGNFTLVFHCWRQRVSQGLDGNDVMLTECGLAAITADSEKVTEAGVMERNAVSLIDRVFIIVLVVAGALVLAF